MESDVIRPLRAIDLFCGAGGATRGLQDAGFHVTGVDLAPQPRYCGDDFWGMDALDLAIIDLWNFDFIWSSPPCQAHVSLKHMHNAKEHVDLIPQTRALLKASGKPYVIENVEGAPLFAPFTLCGTMFGLETGCGAQLLRHRIFETSFGIGDLPHCSHSGGPVIGIYGGHYRNRKRKSGFNRGAKDFRPSDGQWAMGIDWMTGNEMSQAIPPTYSKWIAEQWLEHSAALALEATP